MPRRSTVAGAAYVATPSYTQTTTGEVRKSHGARPDDRLQVMRWEETRTAAGLAVATAVPLLFALGLASMVLSWPASGIGPAVAFWTAAGAAALLRVFVFDRRCDPALAIPLATLCALALLLFLGIRLFREPSAGTVLGVGLVVAAAGALVLSRTALVTVILAAIAAVTLAAIRHGPEALDAAAFLGLGAAVLVATVTYTARVGGLRRLLKTREADRKRDQNLESALQAARDAELKAKRLSESAAAGLLAEREREALRARLQHILDSAGEGIVGTDRDGRIVFANRAAAYLTGYPLSQLLGSDLHDLTHHSHADGQPYAAHACPVRAAIDAERPRDVEGEVFWRSDGSAFPVAYVATPLIEEGGVRGAVVVFQDITERAELERMKDEVVSVVSHELRTPLTSIHGSLRLLENGLNGSASQDIKKLLAIATRNTERLTALVNDLLDLERLRAGRMELAPREVTAAELVAEAAQAMQGLAAQHEVIVHPDGEPVALLVDPHRIHQSLLNLISNAIKFSPRGGHVHVTARQEGQAMCFRVRDEGPGIAPEQQRLLFQRFAQLDSSDAREKGGSGLGLAITRGIVEAHGGSVGIESEPGKGATFLFTLPLPQLQVRRGTANGGPTVDTPTAHHR